MKDLTDWKKGTQDARRELIKVVKEWETSDQSVKQLVFRMKTHKIELEENDEDLERS